MTERLILLFACSCHCRSLPQVSRLATLSYTVRRFSKIPKTSPNLASIEGPGLTSILIVLTFEGQESRRVLNDRFVKAKKRVSRKEWQTILILGNWASEKGKKAIVCGQLGDQRRWYKHRHLNKL